jgi:ubiquinone/menaquinone biosynthesis C-methylase UbiE
MTASRVFDPTSDLHVGLRDEVPLWSALAGALLLDHVPLDRTRVLDVGCGPGFPLLELAERLGPGARATGIDPWAAAVRRAHAKREQWDVPNADLVGGDAAKMPFRDGAFDLVVSNLGVNNFDDARTVVSECRRVLEPGGAFVLCSNLVGTFRELYHVYEAVLRRAGDTTALQRLKEHVDHRATVEGLGRLLLANGLRVHESHRREVTMRFRDGGALLEHHFIRLGFLPAWTEVADGSAERAGHVLDQLRAALDVVARAKGELRLTVPLATVVARAV